MSFPSDDLAVVALGVPSDAPLDPEQAPLARGIHLRWGFRQERGFPWYGFYLFRRPQPVAEPQCWGGGLPPSGTGGTELRIPFGRFSSPQPLRFLDAFAPAGRTEIDLAGRDLIRFDLNEPARKVSVRIGFPAVALPRSCADFRPGGGSGPNPRQQGGFTFEVIYPAISPTFPFTDVVEWPGLPRGLQIGLEVRITLPRPASKVVLLLSNQASVRVQATDAQGRVAADREFAPGALRATVVELTGTALTRVRVVCGTPDAALLHQVCFDSFSDALSEVEMRAFSGTSLIARVPVKGRGGEVVTAVLERDLLTAVEIGPGPAALVDLCAVPVAFQMTVGWQLLAGFEYPLSLPVAHPDYPCPGKPADFAAAENRAAGRVRYGPSAALRGGAFAELHETLQALVAGGPAGPPMAERSLDVKGEAIDPGDGDFPDMPGQRPLDLVLLASLHPAMAQALGLYFVDGTAAPGLAYDYLLLADHGGRLGGRAAAALAWVAGHPSCLQPGAFPSEECAAVDGWLACGKRLDAAPPLAAPTGLQAYALPGATVRQPDGGLEDAQASAGLVWDLRRLGGGDGQLQPDSPVLFHLRRASLGAVKPTAPPGPGFYELITRDRPVLPGQALPPAVPLPEGSPEWPPFPLFAVDSGLAEGWYSYEATGVDIFGRYSARSAPAEWRQWTPRPEPRPWYYQDPPAGPVIHPFAVALLDKIAPPAPSVEAWALDPADPWIEKDGAYKAWRLANPDLLGLRVRWRWTPEQQAQAPDTREFRLYWQPGKWDVKKPDWKSRFHVVRFEDDVDPASRPFRVYEVFLPAPDAAAGKPFAPTLAAPVVYAHVGLSAADGKEHTKDDPKWGGPPWGGRTGNESRISTPAKVVRVLREPPPAPELPEGPARLVATPADYHNRSFFTFRWKPLPLLNVHVLRALDDAVFRLDRKRRPWTLDSADLSRFPSSWNLATRKAAAAELDGLNLIDPPAGLSKVEKDRLWSAAYRKLSDLALRALASQPESDPAFTQMTLQPLSEDDTADRRGPDDAESYAPQAGLRAWQDTLPGRASNRYFYRALFVDGAHNRGALSASSPPVYLPKVEPPRTPVITKVLGGDRKITLRWASNRDPDLAEYRIYRAESEEVAADLRRMELVHTEPVGAGDPRSRPAEVEWVEETVEGGADVFYRIVAVDSAENLSTPSAVSVGRAFDDSRPEPPEWIAPVQGAASTDLALSWQSPILDLACLVQRAKAGTNDWMDRSGWLARGKYEFADAGREPGSVYEYRLRVLDRRGRQNDRFQILSA